MSNFLLAGGLLVAVGLLVMEWRRPNRRHLVFRVVATLAASVALAFLALRPTSSATDQQPTEAALWTFKSLGAGADIGPFVRFVLPDAARVAPPDAKPIPDVGTLHRRLPNLATLYIYGDGIDPEDFSALEGLQVIFHPPERPVIKSPDVCTLAYPRTIAVGEPLVVAGSIGGLSAGSNASLSLESPDGSHAEAATGPADDAGTAPFTLRSPASPAAGRYLWKLKLGQVTRSIGISVVALTLPRVLVLEAGPHFDTPALRRWFEAAGGTLTVRTQIGKEQFRYETSRGTPKQFTALDAALLSGYNLLVVDGSTLTSLDAPEKSALLTAVEKNGLGLLIRADESILAPKPAESINDLLPGKLIPSDDAPTGEERQVRPHWAGQSSALDLPVPAAPFGLEHAPGQEVVVDDRRGNALVAASRRGRGQIALTLVGDTTRWQRANEPGAFAAYWSLLFSRLAGPANDTTGHWSLVDGDAGPVFVDHPLQLRWTGSPDHEPADAMVTDTSATTQTPVPLARQDPRESGVWETMFWPRHSGWHRLTDRTGAASLDFYVDVSTDWPAVQSTRRRLATERFAAQSAALKPDRPASVKAWQIPPGWWLALFFLATGYLWIERRFSSNLTAHP